MPTDQHHHIYERAIDTYSDDGRTVIARPAGPLMCMCGKVYDPELDQLMSNAHRIDRVADAIFRNVADTPSTGRHCDDQQVHGPHDWWLDMRGLACPGTFPPGAADVMTAFSEALEAEWEQQSTRTPDFGRLAAVVINAMGGLGMAVLPDAELESVRAERDRLTEELRVLRHENAVREGWRQEALAGLARLAATITRVRALTTESAGYPEYVTTDALLAALADPAPEDRNFSELTGHPLLDVDGKPLDTDGEAT